jgi:hypothetical protein
MQVRAAEDEDDDPVEAKFRSRNATDLTADEWDRLKMLRAALPEATIMPKLHDWRHGE